MNEDNKVLYNIEVEIPTVENLIEIPADDIYIEIPIEYDKIKSDTIKLISLLKENAA